jgi:hypothetical protein
MRRGELRPRLDVRDRGGDQLGELGEPVLDVVAQRLALRHAGADHAPQLAVDDDRGAGARVERMRAIAPGAEHARRAVGLVAPDHHQRHAEHPSHLPRDGGEHVRRRRPAGHEHRHTAQRGSLRLEDRVHGKGEDGAATARQLDRRRNVGVGDRLAVAQRGGRGGIGEHDHAVGIEDHDRLLGRLQHRTEETLAQR